MTGHFGNNRTQCQAFQYWNSSKGDKIEDSGHQGHSWSNKPYSGTLFIDFGPSVEVGSWLSHFSWPCFADCCHGRILWMELYRIWCPFDYPPRAPCPSSYHCPRPHVGEPGNFTRTQAVVTWPVSPFAPAVSNNVDTYTVGKINDIFNGAGIQSWHEIPAVKTVQLLTAEDGKDLLNLKGFSFTNLVDLVLRAYNVSVCMCFCSSMIRLPEKVQLWNDLLLITADHGNIVCEVRPHSWI